MSLHWENALREVYGISADLTRLDGEYDLNFRATTESGAGYILKVMRTGCAIDLVDVQCKAFAAIKRSAPDVCVPEVVVALNGEAFVEIADENGEVRLVWLLEQLEGIAYADFSPKTLDIIAELGAQLGRMDKALDTFTHEALQRPIKWNLTAGGWIKAKLDVIADPSRRAQLDRIIADFEAVQPTLNALPNVAIHNDLNDYNILVTSSLTEAPKISGLIDLGDMIAAPRICDLAIAAAYVVLDHETPEAALAALVSGYHDAHPLTAAELDMLFPLLKMRLAVSVVNSTLMAEENPDDPYVVISQAPAWRFLERCAQGRSELDPGLIKARMRCACGLPVTDAAPRILAFLDAERGNFASVMGEDISDAPMGALSVAEATIPLNPFAIGDAEAAELGVDTELDGTTWLGHYGEPRLVYTDLAFRKGPWKASNRRTVHIAVDAFAPAGRVLHAPMAARVEVIADRDGHLDYGGMIILSHQTPEGDAFYTLYGHLNPEFMTTLKVGQALAKGEAFCRLGDASQNGGWAPHLHFQVALTTDGMSDDWPGVADPDERYLWERVCPNPAALLNLPDEKVAYTPIDTAEIVEARRKHFGANVKLSYKKPAMFLRGWRHHLFDEMGRPYLDAYNNVPHVGHAHPRIQAVAADQLKRINSNTRYLHPAQTAFADKILSKMPESLSVCYFVNSGSEANELALRLARAHSAGTDIITPDHGYHGNTTGAIAISAYKFNKPNGVGQADWVQLVEVADDYQGRFKRDDADCGRKYADLVDGALAKISARGARLSGFIAETFPSVGGQIIPPKGYLKQVYEKVRAAGGVCIADEVQTGLGRLGDYYFAFEQQEVLPDIVVLGKPIGNGHPLGVVITSPEIAASFANGIEYFSTFGGSTLSCRMGKEVLDIVDDEGLQENARAMGGKLLAGLRDLQTQYAVVGDVRGFGLFVGVELVLDRSTREPATALANYVLNRLRECRILIGTEGPHDNVLKIRPPLTIDAEGVDMILTYLERILSETACITNAHQSMHR